MKKVNFVLGEFFSKNINNIGFSKTLKVQKDLITANRFYKMYFRQFWTKNWGIKVAVSASNLKNRNQGLITDLKNHFQNYPAPSNLSYFWGLGSLLFLVFMVQTLTGLLLLTHYTPDTGFAFESVDALREVWWGWFLRNLHAGGASTIFVGLYIHIARALYYRGFRKVLLWYTGIILFILTMAVAFCGYVLPWGQMSYWGATVISNLFTTLPYWGKAFVDWLWGGFSVGNGTLRRFLTIHFTGAFVLLGIIVLHLRLLHDLGSSRPKGNGLKLDQVRFGDKYITKDAVGIFFIGIFFIVLAVFFWPHYLGHPDNFIKANPGKTPEHIQPEWYFLGFYAILRAMPSKDAGVVAMGMALLVLIILPIFMWFFGNQVCATSSFLGKVFFWLFIADFIFLFWLGAQPIELPYISWGEWATAFYFFYILICLPTILIWEIVCSKKLLK